MEASIKLANLFFRQKRYEEAMRAYVMALKEFPEMSRFINFDIGLVERRVKSRVVGDSLPKDDLLAGNSFNINILKQIVNSPELVNQWLSLNHDSFFSIDFDSKVALKKSGYDDELYMHNSHKLSTTMFFIDTDRDFNETESLQAATIITRLSRGVHGIAKSACAIRFKPNKNKDNLWIGTLLLDKISECKSIKVMLPHPVSVGPDFVGYSMDTASNRIGVDSDLLNLHQVEHSFNRYNESFKTQCDAIDYKDWIEKLETPSLPTFQTVQTTIRNFSNKPRFSIVLPVYNTPEGYLRACLDSVLAQSYPYWELCIADDHSSNPTVRYILQEYEQKDSRIRIVYRHVNGHISRASNSALNFASGDYVALLDHDDMLSEHALYFVTLAIQENPDALILYSDEDKLNGKDQRFDPHFKSDWNPDLFYSQNYLSHLGVFRRELLHRIGGFRIGVEGSQDYDLILRCLPHVETHQIIHIPRVLYHWRSCEGSTALASGEKSYTTEAGINSITDYFAENGPQGIKVDAGLVPNTYRVRWPIPCPAPFVSLLIPTCDQKAITEIAVHSIIDKTTYKNYEILILDNGSMEPETLEWFCTIQKEDRRVKVYHYDRSCNYSAIKNYGVRHSRGSLIGLINNNIEVISPDWLSEMVSQAIRKDIGCVGAKIYYEKNALENSEQNLYVSVMKAHSTRNFSRNNPGYFARLMVLQNVSIVPSTCLLVRREIYEGVGGLDEVNLKVAFNDVDFCLKVNESGYRNLWTPYAEIYNHEIDSLGYHNTLEKQQYLRIEAEFIQAKWGNMLKEDPYYPNLTNMNASYNVT